ncbi:hypothetical protein [Celeribacter neptunius]|uniref:Uncharacterized protein n=1 Tax=Celeribacter neptunius TaxID=588602 RepID=A0A1I3UM17_9RHOB|nr:hypothetical protein [Celeribacter neptunius]SFJ82956.1 hypothetical protein SAMN04487991_3083 [Celeribacter neptunius]
MSNPHDIPQSGQRLVWVLSYDGPVEDLNAELISSTGFAEALGLWVPPASEAVEWFDLAAMTDYGFARYLEEASGFDIGDDAEKLDALEGVVVMLYSTGLNAKETRLAPEPPFALIGRYGMPLDLSPIEKIESDSAAGLLPQGKPPKSPARISGMVATLVLVFLAAFVALFVWIGG